nr:aminotransferase class I/II-fold pyridoxal phosphate-dependent enzyme [uncultured Actinomyces sp.]
MNHLEELLSADDPSTPKLIALEFVYSMDGDTADLPGVVDLAQQYNALTYLDEVHAIGLYREQGRGIADREGILFWTGSM